MAGDTLSGALEREHREIDAGIESFTAGLAQGKADPGPLMKAVAALRRHIYLEEEFLFPPLRQGALMAPIFVMLREHGELWTAMDALTELIDEGADPQVVLDSCRDLLDRLDRHNSKEEPIIYPQADEGLPESARAELGQFIASGQMPSGWVCDRARPGGAKAPWM